MIKFYTTSVYIHRFFVIQSLMESPVPPVSGYLSAHKPEHSNQSRGRTIPLLELIYEPVDDLVLDYKY